jgi:phosphoribosylformylglycinamidine synthase
VSVSSGKPVSAPRTARRAEAGVTARVYVTLKPGVLDPQGQAVAKTLGRLGFDEVCDVRIGKYIEVDLNGAADGDGDVRARVTQMCERLIANTVIEDFRIELPADPDHDGGGDGRA